MKKIFVLLVVVCAMKNADAQLLMSKNAQVSFHSTTLLENIDAVNQQVMAVLDVGKKKLAFSCLMKQFVFPKKLMQEHFNENYVESDKYPKATFSGTWTETIDITKKGNYPLTIRGKVTLHGVTREIEVPATIVVEGEKVSGTSTFKLNPTDFNISIPFIVRNKIEKENTVKVQAEWIAR